MKIKINNDQIILSLEKVKGKMLMKEKDLFCIQNFETITETEEKSIKKFSSETEKIKITYVTLLVIRVYHQTGKFVGTYTDKAAEEFISHYDLFKLRQNWKDFLEQLNAFDLDVCEIDESDKEKYKIFKKLSKSEEILKGKTDLDIINEFRKKYEIPEKEFLSMIDLIKK